MEEKIKKWLLEGGFPLEMKLSNILLDNEFEVAQSIYFRDSESNKFRETDIIASKFINKNGLWIYITFVIECKKSNDKPWVILMNKGITNQIENQLPIYHTQNAQIFLLQTNKETDFKSDLLFRNNREFGYTLQTAFNKGVDRSYESIQSVTKACEYFSQKSNERSKVCALYFPVIVVEGKLFKANYKNQDIELKATESAEILFTRSFHEHGNANILLFNASNLNNMVDNLNKLASEFFKEYDNLLSKYITFGGNTNAYG